MREELSVAAYSVDLMKAVIPLAVGVPVHPYHDGFIGWMADAPTQGREWLHLTPINPRRRSIFVPRDLSALASREVRLHLSNTRGGSLSLTNLQRLAAAGVIALGQPEPVGDWLGYVAEPGSEERRDHILDYHCPIAPYRDQRGHWCRGSGTPKVAP
jgi:hypothetical protein